MEQPQVINVTNTLLDQFEKQELEINKIKNILSDVSSISLDKLNQIDSEDISLNFETYSKDIDTISSEPSLCYWHEDTKDLYVIILKNLKIFCIHSNNWDVDVDSYYQC